MKMWWLFASGSALLWGLAYVVLPALSGVSPYVINVYSNAIGVCLNVIVGVSVGNFDWSTISSLNYGLLTVYAIPVNAGSILYLLALKQPDAPSAVITALSSCYYAISVIGIIVVYQQFERLRLTFAISGILCSIAGTILLSFSFSS